MSDPTPATPPPAAVPAHPDEPLLTFLADRCRCPAPVLLRGDDLDDDRCVTCVAIARIRRLRAALAAAEQRAQQAEDEREKHRFSSRQFCGWHVGVPQDRCPVCELLDARALRAAANRDTERAVEEAAVLRRRLERAEAALTKINDIRNSIIGAQAVNWSEHIYPLVAALHEAGIDGQHHAEARAHVGTLLERLAAAERERDAANQRADDLRDQLGRLLDDMRPRVARLEAERDAARDEVERMRATLKAADTLCEAVEWAMGNYSIADLTTTPVAMMIGVERDLNRAAGAYRQQRAAAGDTKETKPC